MKKSLVSETLIMVACDYLNLFLSPYHEKFNVVLIMIV